MKTLLIGVVFYLGVIFQSEAYLITINEADDARFDFTVVDFDVPGGGGLYTAGLWQLDVVEHGNIGEFAVFGPNNLFNAFFAGFFVQGFGVAFFNGRETVSVDRGFRFQYDAPLPSAGVPDSGATIALLLTAIAALGALNYLLRIGKPFQFGTPPQAAGILLEGVARVNKIADRLS
jgi:hypothetical protein